MGGAQKRSQEEGSHSPSPFKYSGDDGLVSSNTNPSIHLAKGEDVRVAKIARGDSRDAERRSPVQSTYWIPSSSLVTDSHSHITCTVVTGSGSDSPALKEVKKSRKIKVEVRDPDVDARDMSSHLGEKCKDGKENVEGPRNDEKEENVEGNEAFGQNEIEWKSDDGYLNCKPEVSTMVYKAGECIWELVKLWKEYESSLPDKSDESLQSGPTLEIQIPPEYVTATNRQVKGRQLWGTDVYTNDSDVVAVLIHSGYFRRTASRPPPTLQHFCATIRVLPPQDCYVPTWRNNLRSRAWGAPTGCSYRVECCRLVKKGGRTIDLEPCHTHSSTFGPTLAPVSVECKMTTRAAASKASWLLDVMVQYNLCNEPWIMYSISIVADKGLKKPHYTSARLKKGEVLYLETHTRRYELCFSGEKTVKGPTDAQHHEANTEKCQNHGEQYVNGDCSHTDGDALVIDTFRWSRCKQPLPQQAMRSIGIPLPLDHLEVLEENLDWEDVRWSQTGVWIAGKEYHLVRLHFLSPK